MARQNRAAKSCDVPREPGLASRFLAFQSLQNDSVKSLPTDRIWTLADGYEIPARDRPLAYEILAGSIKMRATLDHLIGSFSDRSTRRISSDVLTLLRLGAYQLIYEDQVPDFAAVDTSCELAKRCIGRRQAGFVNAILRNIQRGMETRNVAISEENAKSVIPTGLASGVKFSKPILPGLSDAANHLSLAYSFPRWLVVRWLARWDATALPKILSALNARPAMIVRPNRLKLASPVAETLVRILGEQSCQVRILSDSESVELIEHPPITELQAFRDGLFQVQDPTTMTVVKNIAAGPGMKILDLCAGLGTKTTQLAEVTLDQAEVYATDTIGAKLDRLRQNAERLGLKSIRTMPIEELNSPSYREFFDAVLLDVPCSNTGVLDRRPEARWRLKEADFAAYTRQSLELLTRADALAKPTGRIAFSTCSIDDDENSTLIRDFCARRSWIIEKEHIQLPEVNPADGKTVRSGGYWAILERTH